jgi:hypothetical protein
MKANGKTLISALADIVPMPFREKADPRKKANPRKSVCQVDRLDQVDRLEMRFRQPSSKKVK